jgi:hypothetical protein
MNRPLKLGDIFEMRMTGNKQARWEIVIADHCYPDHFKCRKVGTRQEVWILCGTSGEQIPGFKNVTAWREKWIPFYRLFRRLK